MISGYPCFYPHFLHLVFDRSENFLCRVNILDTNVFSHVGARKVAPRPRDAS